MKNMELLSKVLRIEDFYGKVVEIRMPPVLVAEEYRQRLIELYNMGDEEGIKTLSFEDAYKTIKKYRRLVRKILGIFQVDSDKLSVDMVCQLLYPYEDENQIFHTQGALTEFIFGPINNDPNQSELTREEIDQLANTWGTLWAITNDFGEAVDILNTLNYSDLDKVISARNEAMMSPEERMKKKQKDASKKLADKIRKGEVGIKEEKGKELSDNETDNIIKNML